MLTLPANVKSVIVKTRQMIVTDLAGGIVLETVKGKTGIANDVTATEMTRIVNVNVNVNVNVDEDTMMRRRKSGRNVDDVGKSAKPRRGMIRTMSESESVSANVNVIEDRGTRTQVRFRVRLAYGLVRGNDLLRIRIARRLRAGTGAGRVIGVTGAIDLGMLNRRWL